MCGIVGYIGDREAQPVLVNSLRRLEYRGYDSCGIAVLNGKIKTYKDIGGVAKLAESVSPMNGGIGIGHTRWATHGRPSQVNAHPHLDCQGKIAVVHNGVIDNFQELRDTLTAEGHVFRSETDTEVIAHLVEKYFRGDLVEAVKSTLADIEGSYAVVVIHTSASGLVIARNGSPLVVGIGDREYFIASDVPALLDYTNKVYYLEDRDIGLLEKDGLQVENDGHAVKRQEHQISWSVEETEKDGYEHHMLKEIHEQPKVIEKTIRGRLSTVEPVIDTGIVKGNKIRDILFLACGTSYHAALVGEHVIQSLAGIPARAKMASEFGNGDAIVNGTWTIGISQSGETSDTLKALKIAADLSCPTLAITNVMGSSITRIADQTFYLNAGPEISVAATKSFASQLIALYLLALSHAKVDIKTRKNLINELRLLPDKVKQLLDNQEQIIKWSSYLAQFDNAFFIARGINMPVALEGALKMKEISYIHAEGYAAGELKHGPLALLTPKTPVVGIAARDSSYEAMLTNIKEVEARDTPVICLAEEDDYEIEKYVFGVIRVPRVNTLFSPLINAIALQVLAYYTARERRCPIDKPRNLAKSVTVG
ncbi:glutamine--fructose-6-phosphate transaminase (isomerizing) [Chloroflexota bacterium]